MADTDELQTARVIRLGAGSFVDNDFRNVETVLRLLFGITADADYSEAMQIGVGPHITMTGDLTLAQAPTEDLHAATKKYVDDEGATAASVRCTVLSSDGDQAIAAGVTAAIEWDETHIEAGGDCWDVGEKTRMMFPSAGDYLITGCIQAVLATGSPGPTFNVSMKANGSTYLYTLLGYGANKQGANYRAAVPFAVMEKVSKDDYIEIMVTALALEHGIENDCYLSIMKVG